MSIDDRLRGAHQRQLQDVRDRVSLDGSSHRFVPAKPSASTRVLAIAAVVLALCGGLLGLRALLDSSTVTVLETDVGAESEPPSSPVPTIEVDVDQGRTTPATATTTTTQIAAQATAATSSEPVTTEAADPGVPTVMDNGVCPSGRRAALERATLRYVGDNQGWGRLFDLVDEQDELNYYMAWEPGYPDPVTVEVELPTPVLATEIRLAQDPFTPVSGIVSIMAANQDIELVLDGVGGWQVHIFDRPVELDRFTITRAAAESNVLEVLVCVVGES